MSLVDQKKTNNITEQDSSYEESDEEKEYTYTLFEFIKEMTTNLGVKKNWKTLTRYPRINGVNVKRLSGPSENGHYVHGLVIKRTSLGYDIEDITSENKELKLSSFSQYDKKGNIVGGRVNCFVLGYMPIDKGYIQELFEGFIYNKNNKEGWKWDKIV